MAVVTDPAAPAASVPELPHWDMTPVFPGLDSPELGAAFDGVLAGMGELGALCDRHNVRRREALAVDDATVAAFEEVTERLNALSESLRTLSAYLHAFVATDSRNDLAQAKLSELQTEVVALEKLETRYSAWIGSLDVEALIARSSLAGAHAFALRKAAGEARHQMSEAEEDLAASLNLCAGTAWAKLHGTVSSQARRPRPLSRRPARRGRDRGRDAGAPDERRAGPRPPPRRAVRQAAYEAEPQGWETVAAPLAARHERHQGAVLTLNLRRGWPDALAPALFANNVDRVTLEAMHEACRESFPDFRRYLQAKARLLGRDKLPWCDLFAP